MPEYHGKDVPFSQWTPARLEKHLRFLEELNDGARGTVAALRELVRQRQPLDVIEKLTGGDFTRKFMVALLQAEELREPRKATRQALKHLVRVQEQLHNLQLASLNTEDAAVPPDVLDSALYVARDEVAKAMALMVDCMKTGGFD